jgi:FAD-dependent sensor of blue light
MSQPVHNIVYVSQATRSLTASELDSILQDARQFNAENRITGVLFYAQGHFFQFLEGSPEDLDSVMQRIQSARCHADIRILLDSPGGRRHFTEWHMAFAEPPNSELQMLSNAAWDESIPLTRDGIEKPEALALVLSCWSMWGAGHFHAAP